MKISVKKYGILRSWRRISSFCFVYLYIVWISITSIYLNDTFIIRKFNAKGKNIFNSHILIKGPQAHGCALGFPRFTYKDQQWQYIAPLSERGDGLQCSTLQQLPVFGKVRRFSTLAIYISSNKTEIKNYNLKYLNPMGLFPF